MLLPLLIIVLGLIAGLIMWLNTGLGLPKNVDTLVKEVMAEEVPELITGTTGTAKNAGVSIFYESIMPKGETKGTVVLIGGYGQILLDWQAHVWRPLIEAGYQVVRFDNRGVGGSDWMKNWSKDAPYSLEDMAKDTIAVLDALGLEKVHLVGMSMGGMISQRLAISHSERVQSLTSIMSSGYYYDPELVNIPRPFLIQFYKLMYRFGPFLSKMENRLKLHLSVQKMLEGNGYERDAKEILQKAYYENTKRKGFNIKAGPQQGKAIKVSGSRYEELKELSIPTLVVHGTEDTLITFEHAPKYAAMIPNAKTLFIEGMGHDLPRTHVPTIIQKILLHFSTAEQAIQTI